MGLKYCWALECRYCGERTVKSGGPSGHGAMLGDCDDRTNHSETVILGPQDVRKLRAELGSYEAVQEKFVDEELDKDELHMWEIEDALTSVRREYQ